MHNIAKMYRKVLVFFIDANNVDVGVKFAYFFMQHFVLCRLHVQHIIFLFNLTIILIPNGDPSIEPTNMPTVRPSIDPSSEPTLRPSSDPS